MLMPQNVIWWHDVFWLHFFIVSSYKYISWYIFVVIYIVRMVKIYPAILWCVTNFAVINHQIKAPRNESTALWKESKEVLSICWLQAAKIDDWGVTEHNVVAAKRKYGIEGGFYGVKRLRLAAWWMVNKHSVMYWLWGWRDFLLILETLP